MTNELYLLRDLIHERTGLFFADGRATESLESRLGSLIENAGCGSLSAYCQLLHNQPDSPEWLTVIAALSKPVSSFFRHNNRVDVLVNKVVPQFVVTEKREPLKIWSAGCATGEEPLSIAMALSNAGWFDRANIEINASDASITAIEKARAGVYGEKRVEYLSPQLRDRYFEHAGGERHAAPELHGRIRWSIANLMNEDEISELAASHIIFCRNVFIYFSDASICKTLALFAKHMPTGGYLFTDGGDHFTSLMKSIGIFEEERVNGISIWKKVE